MRSAVSLSKSLLVYYDRLRSGERILAVELSVREGFGTIHLFVRLSLLITSLAIFPYAPYRNLLGSSVSIIALFASPSKINSLISLPVAQLF
jgi:hypothetical protein